MSLANHSIIWFIIFGQHNNSGTYWSLSTVRRQHAGWMVPKHKTLTIPANLLCTINLNFHKDSQRLQFWIASIFFFSLQRKPTKVVFNTEVTLNPVAKSDNVFELKMQKHELINWARNLMSTKISRRSSWLVKGYGASGIQPISFFLLLSLGCERELLCNVITLTHSPPKSPTLWSRHARASHGHIWPCGAVRGKTKR